MAQKAGLLGGTIEGKSVLLGGDIILSVNEHQFNNQQSVKQIMQTIKDFKPGGQFKIVIWCKGKRKTITLGAL